jgi:hypothetical protein
VKPGDPVVYLRDPLLYGEMEIGHIRKDGRLLCIINPDARRPEFEIFDANEIDYPKPLAA